jgi:transcriptional regulator with XRE-family HTH domain
LSQKGGPFQDIDRLGRIARTAAFVSEKVRRREETKAMIIGDRLRVLREHKKLSQGDIEKRTGLLRCYISRVECGHTVPAVETLEKFARALEVPIYQLFYEGEEPPKLPSLPKRKSSSDIVWGSTGREARLLVKFCQLCSRMSKSDLKLLFFMARKMARSKAG